MKKGTLRKKASPFFERILSKTLFQMKFPKLVSNTLITGSTVLPSSVFVHAAKVSAAACQHASTRIIISLATGCDEQASFK